MGRVRDELMSTLDPSTPRPSAPTTDVNALLGTVRTVVTGAAFWASIPLPLVVLAALLSGVATAAPLAFVGLVLVNVCCAALGHTYTPAK